MKLFSLLGIKLFALILTILLVAFGGALFIILKIHRSDLESGKIGFASSTAEIIKNAIHDRMMLTNKSKEISTVIANIGQGEGIEGIRIFNKRGEIIHTSRSDEKGLKVDKNAEACVSCHREDEAIVSPPGSLHRFYAAPDGHRVLGLISPIANQPGCSISSPSCHHPPDQKVLGVLDVRLSLAGVDRAIASSSRAMLLWAGGIVLLAALASAVFIQVMVHRPVAQLIQGTEEIARGNLGYRIQTRSRDEIGKLAGSFDAMSSDLQRARDEVTAWSSTLEERVRQKTAELEQAQERMLQVERMASLGKLAATVAHELNNPLAGILTYAKLILRRLSKSASVEKVEESIEELRIIEGEARRCGNIINNLLVFARGGRGEIRPASLQEIVERALAVVRHHLESQGVKVEWRGPAGSDAIQCDPDLILEALVALFINAAEAMPQGGVLAVRAEREGGGMTIEISDTGCGIPPEVLPHIFEPFFTTKKNGKGLGLGLAVVFGIIQRHGGTIEAKSRPGSGATFRIALPSPGQDGTRAASGPGAPRSEDAYSEKGTDGT